MPIYMKQDTTGVITHLEIGTNPGKDGKEPTT